LIKDKDRELMAGFNPNRYLEIETDIPLKVAAGAARGMPMCSGL
jgi:hypothetical protein